MAVEMITVEYAGLADRWSGPGTVHEVRAWWNVNQASVGKVKRAAMKEVQGQVTGHVEYVGMDMSTYNTPNLNAMIRIRVLTTAEVAKRAELKTRVYRTCDKCGSEQPSEVVRMDADGTEKALCYACWHPVKRSCKVLHWINKYGKIQGF